MPITALLGAAWGDEGKGRVSHALAPRHHAVCRFNGGPNAAHKVQVEGKTWVLRQVPAGIFGATACFLGCGMLLEARELVRELAALRSAGVSIDGVRISERAHVILPVHRERGEEREERLGQAWIGTTGQGVGDASADRAVRVGLQVRDLLDERRLRERLSALDDGRTRPRALRALERDLSAAGEALAPHVDDTAAELRDRLRDGQRLLAEGAQGTLLDVAHGLYPYVTSGHTTVGAVPSGLGVPASAIDQVVLVLRAYAHRASKGPLPTELPAALETEFRQHTQELALRVGWLDLVALRYAVEVNGATALALTHLDAVAGMPQLRLGRAYLRDGAALRRYPTAPDDHQGLSVDWLTLDGFELTASPTSSMELPGNARAFVSAIGEAAGVSVRWVSLGPSGPLLEL